MALRSARSFFLARRHFLIGAAGYACSLGFFCAYPARADDPAQERQLGKAIYASLKSHGQIVSVSSYYAVLRRVGEKVSNAARPHWFTMNFIIIEGSQPNAFSAPGGNVYVTESLLSDADNEDELANVLGHETGHLVLGHIANRLSQAQHVSFFQRLSHAFVHNKGSQNTVAVANGVVNYSFLNFSRAQEYAADEEGIKLAAKAGFNPWGTVWFFETMESMYGNTGFEQYVQQHPSTKDRIKRVEDQIKKDRRTYGHWSSALRTSGGLSRDSADDRLVVHS